MKKRLCAFLLILALIPCIVPAHAAETASPLFTDVAEDAWYREAIEYVYTYGLMNGTSANCFSPEETLTRAMLVTILHRMEGSPAPAGENPYTDVRADYWYTAAILWAGETGLAAGYGNGLFGPDDLLTREQAITMLMRYGTAKGLPTDQRADLSGYTDAGQISLWALQAMEWACAVGLISGEENHLSPKNITLRAEAAVMIMRFHRLSGSADTVTLSFDTRGGSVILPQILATGALAAEPEAPTRQGYTFTGWTTAGTAEPFDFSVPITEDTRLTACWTAQAGAGTDVPILIYHALTEADTPENEMFIPAAVFRAQMQLLYSAGYDAILYRDLYDYVTTGKALPLKPVLITFDDGYTSNLTLAAPILQEFGFCAEIAVIGNLVGKDVHDASGVAITPHFTLEEAQPWVDAGVIALHSHSYAMHQMPDLDGADCRIGILQRPDESDSAYTLALQKDYTDSALQLYGRADPDVPQVFTYPHGRYTERSEEILGSLGVDITVATQNGIARITAGDLSSLRCLPRIIPPNASAPKWFLNLLKTQ